MTQLALIAPTEKSYVTVIDGRPMTSSLDIANRFDREHKSVLRAIAKLECSPEFSQRNFAPAEFLDAQGKRRPAYRITRDGFAFLAMGFTGKEAARWKEAYINAFNIAEAKAQQETVDHLNMPALYNTLKKINILCQEQVLPALSIIKSPAAPTLREHLRVACIIASSITEHEKRNKLTTKSR